MIEEREARSVDSVSGDLADGRCPRCLSVADDSSHESGTGRSVPLDRSRSASSPWRRLTTQEDPKNQLARSRRTLLSMAPRLRDNPGCRGKKHVGEAIRYLIEVALPLAIRLEGHRKRAVDQQARQAVHMRPEDAGPRLRCLAVKRDPDEALQFGAGTASCLQDSRKPHRVADVGAEHDPEHAWLGQREIDVGAA